jgi:tetratricopeptide (TPR) repeat protein
MAQAYLCYVEALRIQPTFAIAWSNLAGLLMEAGELQRALNYYKVWIASSRSDLAAALLASGYLSSLRQ